MIEMAGVSKSFGKVLALQDLTLTIPEGCIYGLVGPNGAGKTTAMSILATLLPADSGRARVCGLDVTVDTLKVRRAIGYMPDFFGVYDGLTAREYLSFFAAAYHIPEASHDGLIDKLLELVNLPEKIDADVDTLSRGMKQRLALARSLVHDPRVLILDEPASGLDPRARAEVKEIVRQLKGMGKTVLISSHILPELAEMCDEIGILEKGRLVASGPVPDITSGGQDKRIILVDIDGDRNELLEYLMHRSEVEGAQGVKGSVRLVFSGDRAAQGALLKELIDAGYNILQFAEQRNSLEDVFMAVTGEVGS